MALSPAKISEAEAATAAAIARVASGVPVDRAAAEAALARLWAALGVADPPPPTWAQGPSPADLVVEDGRVVPLFRVLLALAEELWAAGSDIRLARAAPLLFRTCLFAYIAVRLDSVPGPWRPAADALVDLSRQVGDIHLISPRGFVLGERPPLLRYDRQLRYHAGDGPALRWSDGTGGSFWHGTRVDPEWLRVPSTTLTAQAIRAQPNAELRRIMCEILGWEAAMDRLGARLVDRDVLHGQPRELYDVQLEEHRPWGPYSFAEINFHLGVFPAEVLLPMTLMPDRPAQTARLVRLVNGTVEADGTRHTFVEPVPAACRTPQDAVAWQYGLSTATYREQVRT